MKTLKKALALVLAVSVMAVSGSALAAVEGNCTITGGSSTYDTSYDASAKSLTVAAPGANVGDQMTFVILDKDANVTNVAEGDILYVDQKAATASDKSFTGKINLLRVTGASGEMPDGSYPVRIGYYNSAGDFQLGVGNLVISTIVPAAVNSITTDATANATAGEALAITATVNAVGGASTAYTWTVTSKPDGATATVTGNSFVADKVGTYVVTAASDYDDSKTATKTITVTDSAPTLTSASIDGDSSAYTDETVTLTGSFVNSGKPGVTLTWSVEGGATLSTTEGATTVVTPSGVGTVTVTLTATSETGVVQTDTHTITFTERPAGGGTRTVTIKWGDIALDGAANSSDVSVLLYAAVDKGAKSWSYGGYTFTFNSDTVTDSTTSGQYVMTAGGSPIKWGDIALDGAANSSDVSVLLYAAVDKGAKSWSLKSGVATFNTNLDITLTPKAE